MTEQKPPLWEVMRDAYDVSPPLPVDANLDQINRNGYAAEIRAVRDWLVPEEEPPATDDRLARDWTVRMRLRDLLTAEADRAERANMADMECPDTRRLRWVMHCCEGFTGVTKDRYDYAMELAAMSGRDEPNEMDELNGFRLLIDAAMAAELEGSGEVDE